MELRTEQGVYYEAMGCGLMEIVASLIICVLLIIVLVRV